MTEKELNDNIDKILNFFRANAIVYDIDLSTLNLASELFNVQQSMIKSDLIREVGHIGSNKGTAWELTEKGKSVLLYSGWSSYLNHDIELKRLTLENLKKSNENIDSNKTINFWQIIIAGLIAVATIVQTTYVVKDFYKSPAGPERHKQYQHKKQNTKIDSAKQNLGK